MNYHKKGDFYFYYYIFTLMLNRLYIKNFFYLFHSIYFRDGFENYNNLIQFQTFSLKFYKNKKNAK